MNYAILHFYNSRTAIKNGRPVTYTHKAKTSRDLSMIYNHDILRTTAYSADPSKIDQNDILYDRTGGTKSLNDVFREMVTAAGATVRENSVRAIDMCLSYGSDKEGEAPLDIDYEKWRDANVKWVKDTFGEKNIMLMTVHRDEAVNGAMGTPHIHVVICPLTEDGRLSAKDIIGGPTGIKKHQNSYAQAMSEFGLHRGQTKPVNREGIFSQAQFYAARKKEVASGVEDILPEVIRGESAEQYRERVKPEMEKVSGRASERIAQAISHEQTALALEEERKAELLKWKQKQRAAETALAQRDKELKAIEDALRHEEAYQAMAKNDMISYALNTQIEGVDPATQSRLKETLNRLINIGVNDMQKKGQKVEPFLIQKIGQKDIDWSKEIRSDSPRSKG